MEEQRIVSEAGRFGIQGRSETLRPAGILGGCKNTVTGNFSAILGGCNNNDNGFAFAGFFGTNLLNPTAMSPNTFHVNCLNAVNTPAFFAGPYPHGTVSYYSVAAGFPAGLAVGTRLLVITP